MTLSGTIGAWTGNLRDLQRFSDDPNEYSKNKGVWKVILDVASVSVVHVHAIHGMDMNNWHTNNMLTWYLKKTTSSEILLRQFLFESF